MLNRVVCVLCSVYARAREREGSVSEDVERERESQIPTPHTLDSERVPKLGLEFKWVKEDVLVYRPTTRVLFALASAHKPMLSYHFLSFELFNIFTLLTKKVMIEQFQWFIYPNF